MLDLAPIRERLNNIDRARLHGANIIGLYRVLDDFVALLDEVEHLREDQRAATLAAEYHAEKVEKREAEVTRLESIIQNARRVLGAA